MKERDFHGIGTGDGYLGEVFEVFKMLSRQGLDSHYIIMKISALPDLSSFILHLTFKDLSSSSPSPQSSSTINHQPSITISPHLSFSLSFSDLLSSTLCTPTSRPQLEDGL